MKTIKEIRDLFGLSWAIFSRTYHIPIHSLEDWESGRSIVVQLSRQKSKIFIMN